MHKIIRTAVLELATTNTKQIVKVAGIMRRLQNWIKALTNKDYADEVDKIRFESGALQGTAKDLNDKIEELLKAIKNGDVEEYEVSLNLVKQLSNDLVNELKTINKKVEENKPEVPNVPDIALPESSKVKSETVESEVLETYNREMWDDKKIHSEIVNATERIVKKSFPDHDVPIGRGKIGAPVQNFKWFKQYLPDKIHLKEGNQDGGRQFIINQTAKLIERETKLTKDEALDLLKNNLNEFFARLKVAILNGTLQYYYPAIPTKPGEGSIKFRHVGEMAVKIHTSDFIIPEINVRASTLVTLGEVIVTRSEPTLTLATCHYAAVFTGGVPEEWKKPYLGANKPLVENKMSGRLKILQKLSGLNPQASSQLSDRFWIKFVQMCNRLGAKPEDLARVINSESRFDSHAMNVQNGHVVAKGLNQLIKKTALSLGMSEQEWNNYENVSAEDQLQFVEKYFHNVGKATGADGKWASATQLYVANFAPKYVHKSSDPNAVLYNSSDNHIEYLQNKGLDKNKTGLITAGDLARSVSGKLPENIVEAIHKAQGNKSEIPAQTKPSDEADTLLNALLAEQYGPVELLVRKSILSELLPTSNILISISSLCASFPIRLKFAKSVSFVLKNIIDADTSIHINNDKIEMECQAPGSLYAVASATKALCECVSRVFEIRAPKDIEIRCSIFPGTISKYS